METDSVSAPLAYQKILAPFDGSPGSSKALRRALLVAKDCGAEVTVLSVDENLSRYAPAVGEVEEDEGLREAHLAHLREEALGIAEEYGIAVRIETKIGHAAQTIVQVAQQEGFHLVAIGHSGHSGRSGLWGTLLGSTTARVVDQATCDVLVVR